MRIATCILVLIAFLLCGSTCDAQLLRVGSWNVENKPNAGDNDNFSTVIEAMGQDLRPAIFALQETDTNSALEIRDIFNTVFDINSYSVTTSNFDGGSDRTGFVFDTSVVSLVSESEISAGLTHKILRSTFEPISPAFSESFTIYSVQLKSGSSNSDIDIRAAEAAVIKADADLLDATNVLFAGDFNAQSSSQLTNFNAIDVAGAPGDWRDNPDFLDLHTQDPSNSVDDRFDLQLGSAGLFDGVGLDYVAGSFNVFGNNGTHDLNGSIDTGTGSSPEVLAALMNASDHLPVYSDFAFVSVPEPSGIVAVFGFAIFLSARRRRL